MECLVERSRTIRLWFSNTMRLLLLFPLAFSLAFAAFTDEPIEGRDIAEVPGVGESNAAAMRAAGFEKVLLA